MQNGGLHIRVHSFDTKSRPRPDPHKRGEQQRPRRKRLIFQENACFVVRRGVRVCANVLTSKAGLQYGVWHIAQHLTGTGAPKTATTETSPRNRGKRGACFTSYYGFLPCDSGAICEESQDLLMEVRRIVLLGIFVRAVTWLCLFVFQSSFCPVEKWRLSLFEVSCCFLWF